MKKLGMATLSALLLEAGWLQAQQDLPLAAPKGEKAAAPVAAAGPTLMDHGGPGCGSECFDSCGCQSGFQTWFAADLVFWDVKDNRLPLPLVTVGSVLDPIPGAIGQPGTRVVWGGDASTNLGGDLIPGLRFRGGAYSYAANVGVEASVFWLETHSDGISATPDFFNATVIAQPVFNTFSGISDALTDSNPPGLLGGVNIKLRSQLWGAEANLTTGIGNALNGSLLLAGFKYLNLDDDLSFLSGPRVVGIVGNTPLGPGGFNMTQERFTTRNRFYGGQFGAQQSMYWNGLTITGRAALALGASDQEVVIKGGSAGFLANGSPVTVLPGGLLTGPSNLGTHESTHFAVVPTLDLTAGYRVSDNLLAYIGYNFMYWTNVVRPGEQVDLRVDPRGSPLSNVYDPNFVGQFPTVPFDTTSFWVQGINLGLAVTW